MTRNVLGRDLVRSSRDSCRESSDLLVDVAYRVTHRGAPIAVSEWNGQFEQGGGNTSKSSTVTHSYPRVKLLNWFHMRLAVRLAGTRLVDRLTGSVDTP